MVTPRSWQGGQSDDHCSDVPEEASRARKAAAKAGAEIRGEVLLTLAQLSLATPLQLKELLLPHQQDTDHVRCRALRNLLDESPALCGRAHRAQQIYWYCTPAGLAEATSSGELVPTASRTTGKRAASKTDLREHGLALVDTTVAFHHAEAADRADWQVEVARPTPAGSLVPDAVVLLADGSSAFVEIDRTISYARLLAKLERYDAYRNASPSGSGERRPRSALPLAGDLRRTVAGATLPAAAVRLRPRPAPRAPATREAAFHDRARRFSNVNYRMTVATTTLSLLTREGADQPVRRVMGRGQARRSLAALPKPR
ncbi:replication-relaxation family protein [Streptomyces sp. NPDC050842]|uniref:replication-relaxation family protein n=1 Tax=Streptomyces sp. NPDC050842 TaxID=3365636 RepID=UPI0037904D12